MRTLLTIVFGLVIFFGLYKTFAAPPDDFPTPYHITVSNGESLAAIAHQLANDDVIRSSRVFEASMLMLGSEKDISQGEYYFTTPVSTFIIALRISGSEYGIEKERVTFPEGYTNMQMATRLQAVFPTFNAAEFLTMTNDDQGYLFPDTYKFFPTPLPTDVITALKNNYAEKVGPLEAAIVASGHSEHDIIVMASLIEKEAKGSTDSPVIAGILWKRIANGMDLQVDADPWTYSNKGLPVAPVDNPGLVAINAAIHPTASPYLYYLHDASGNVHYASTFAQHQANIKKYLDQK
jgi:UPF0755 protein